jgi:hypothetical protein
MMIVIGIVTVSAALTATMIGVMTAGVADAVVADVAAVGDVCIAAKSVASA